MLYSGARGPDFLDFTSVLSKILAPGQWEIETEKHLLSRVVHHSSHDPLLSKGT